FRADLPVTSHDRTTSRRLRRSLRVTVCKGAFADICRAGWRSDPQRNHPPHLCRLKFVRPPPSARNLSDSEPTEEAATCHQLLCTQTLCAQRLYTLFPPRHSLCIPALRTPPHVTTPRCMTLHCTALARTRGRGRSCAKQSQITSSPCTISRSSPSRPAS